MFYISGLYIAATALLLLVLSYLVVRQRLKYKVSLEDGGLKSISVAMRAQANTLENALPVLLLLMVAEANGAWALLLHICGAGFVAARLLHAWGFTRSQGGLHFGRFYGTLLTWIVMLALIITVLVLSVTGLTSQSV